MHELLKLGDRITVLPVIHGSGDFALEVRRVMLENDFDCVAVPLPPSLQEGVETGDPATADRRRCAAARAAPVRVVLVARDGRERR